MTEEYGAMKDIDQGTANNEAQEITSNALIEKFYFVKLRKKFRKWEKLQSLSYVNLIITTMVCLTSLIVGVFLLVSTKNVVESKARNTLSVIFSGIVSTFSLSGSLASLKNLIFKSKLDTMKKLYAEENELEVTRRGGDWKLKNDKNSKEMGKLGRDNEIYSRKPLYFMSKLTEHMRRMLIFRVLWATLFSIILCALAGISIYTLLTDSDEFIFLLIDKFLIIVSSVFLSIILSVFFLIKVIVPQLVAELDDFQFHDKIELLELFKKKKSMTFKVLSILFGVQILSLYFVIGLFLPVGLKIRRTQMTEKEMNEIMQLLSGVSKAPEPKEEV
ncbi:3548_t:CDS:1 [Acaulospora morrowiae]|uniref:3548_t:CDS:1 n=1 Tax=Acaulospora morrowiae TaxID=94023 RepID=A0A9N8Z4K2_9GLOM|nr:3548_t:CDS:1 [Acaulospora morrowiae]